RAVHGAGGRALEVDSFTVVPAAVAGTLEFVFAGLPIRRASQMGAACIDHEQAIRRAIDPDAIFLLELGIDAEREFGRVTNLKNGVRFKQSARKEKAEEG